MASNIKYPDKELMYFIEGNNLSLISSVDSTGDRNTTDRKNWKAIQESVSNGLLIKYPMTFLSGDIISFTSAITSSPDFNNKILIVICFLLSLYYSIKKGIVKIPKSISNSIYLEVIFTSMMLWNYLTKMNWKKTIIKYDFFDLYIISKLPPSLEWSLSHTTMNILILFFLFLLSFNN